MDSSCLSASRLSATRKMKDEGSLVVLPGQRARKKHVRNVATRHTSLNLQPYWNPQDTNDFDVYGEPIGP
jgi:hypothetical protein